MADKAPAEARPNFFKRWAIEHLRVMFATLGRLWREPGATGLTATVIGVTLALPAGLHVVVRDVSAVSYSWEGTLQVSLFLKDGVGATRGQELTRSLGQHAGVASTHYISREQSLKEFRELSGFGDALDMLDDNPLPAVIVVALERKLPRAQMDPIVDELSRLPEVEVAKLDQKWLDRLYAILGLIERAVMIIAAMLGLAVVVIVGNTIRLAIEGRRDEIIVMKLVGAPDSFIRRPFLYTGFWYGLCGGLVAWILVNVALWALAGPARKLAGLYDSSYLAEGMSIRTILMVLGAGVVLGVLGSAWTVGRHLNRYEPG